MSKNKKKKNKTNYSKYLIIVVVLVLLSVLVYLFLNATDEATDLTIVEKKWIADNKDTLMDINVPNNLNVLADDGEGVIFDYVKKVEKETDLEFNKKSYNYPSDNDNLTGLSILVLKNTDKIKNSDKLIAEDNYVLLGTEDENTNPQNFANQKLGVLQTDLAIIKSSLGVKQELVAGKSVNDLILKLKKKECNYLVLPRYYTLKDAAKNGLFISYTFDNISNKIVLRPGDNKTLDTIMIKYLNKFKQDNYSNSYKKSFMSFYQKYTEVTDMDISSLTSKVYTYGYVKGSKYNVKQSGKLNGYAGEYISMIKSMADMDIDIKEFRSKTKLKNAIRNSEVDIAFIDFVYDNEEGFYTKNGFNSSLIALSKTNYGISSKEGLYNRKLYTLKDTSLENYLKNIYKNNVGTVNKVTSSIPDDAILVLDEVDYSYYVSKNKIEGYYTLMKDSYDSYYKFYVPEEEEVLYKYLNFVLTYADSSDVKKTSISNLTNRSVSQNNFINTYLLIVLAIIMPVIIIFILVMIARNKNFAKMTRKESVLKYTDMLTSLKNRNYLEAHMEEWDDAKISPRSVIVVDLNNLSYVNDNYGQEEGNILIKKAAAILLSTQLEKSEVLRTDGNEFLIYLIGYNESQIKTYINKLSKEFENLPYNFGAGIGYSMIEDEIKTIGDAINEANIAMRKDKEENYK